MAFENLGKCIPVAASTNLSGHQYRFMVINSAGKLAVPGAGVVANGVLQDKPAADGREGSLMVGAGVTKITLGATLAAGVQVVTDNAGKAVAATTGDAILGQLLGEGGGDGAVVAMLFQPEASAFA